MNSKACLWQFFQSLKETWCLHYVRLRPVFHLKKEKDEFYLNIGWW